MTTRSSLQRNNGAPSFHGNVHKWKRAWVTLGDENTPAAKRRMKLLKWVRTDEKTEAGKGPRYPHLVPVDKAMVGEALGQGMEMKIVKNEAPPSPVKEEVAVEEELSVVKRESLSSGDFVDLGFDVTASESTEMSRDNKTQTEPLTEPLTEATSLTMDDEMSEGTLRTGTDGMPTGTDESLEDDGK